MADDGVNIYIKDLRTGRNMKILLRIGDFICHLIHIIYVHISILIHILYHKCASGDFY